MLREWLKIVREGVDFEGNWKAFAAAPDDTKIIMYHVTSTSAAQAIMANGFDSSKRVWTDSDHGYVYLGLSARSLSIYGVHASKADDPPCVLKVEVAKGDVEPDNGGDWKSYLRNPNTKRDVVNQFGPEAVKMPTATVTLAEIGQAKARVAAVIPIEILPFQF